MTKYIEREAAQMALLDCNLIPILGSGDKLIRQSEAAKQLNEVPIADVAPVVHGRWKCHKYIEEYQCEICGHFVRFGTVKNYCPNCGAKMDGGGTNEKEV